MEADSSRTTPTDILKVVVGLQIVIALLLGVVAFELAQAPIDPTYSITSVSRDVEQLHNDLNEANTYLRQICKMAELTPGKIGSATSCVYLGR